MALQQSDMPTLVDMLNKIDIRVQVRRKTAAEWTSSNEVLLTGEWGKETDTGKMKQGDGSTVWNGLDYFAGSFVDAPTDGKTYGRKDGAWAQAGANIGPPNAGTGISIDATNPDVPVISSTVGSIALSGRVATYAALPSGLGASDAGKAYLVDADGRIYVWSGTAWPASGGGFSGGGGGGGGGIVVVPYNDFSSLGAADAGKVVFQRVPVSMAEQVLNLGPFAAYTLNETTGNFTDSGPNGYHLTPGSGVVRSQSPISPITTGYSAKAGSAGIGSVTTGPIGKSVVVSMLLRLPATTGLYGEFFKIGTVGNGFSLGFNNAAAYNTGFNSAVAGRWLGIGQNGISYRSQLYNCGSAAREMRLTISWQGNALRIWVNGDQVFTTTSYGDYSNPSPTIKVGSGENADVSAIDIDDVIMFVGTVPDTTIRTIIRLSNSSAAGVWTGSSLEPLA